MRRRAFIAVLASTGIAWPLDVRSQGTAGVFRIGMVSPINMHSGRKPFQVIICARAVMRQRQNRTSASDPKRTFPALALSSVAQRINDQSKRRRGLASAWIEEVIPGIGEAPVLEHALKTPFGEVPLDHAFRHIGQARPGERRIEDLNSGIEGELTLDAHPQLATAFLELPRVHPAM
jgi:hypothetical protein